MDWICVCPFAGKYCTTEIIFHIRHKTDRQTDRQSHYLFTGNHNNKRFVVFFFCYQNTIKNSILRFQIDK